MSAGSGAATAAAGIGAFVRRDLLLLLSERGAIAADALQAGVLVALFVLIGRLVDPSLLPAYGGERAGYAEFAAIGALLCLALATLLSRAAGALHRERAAGTLDAVLATPVRRSALHAGPLAFGMLEAPLRMALYVAVAALAGVDFELLGALPALAALLVVMPFAWGLGLVVGATAGPGPRHGTTAVAALALGLTAGAYVPLGVLPSWLESVLELNPVAVALEAMRGALIGGEGWHAVGSGLLVQVLVSLLTLAAGAAAFSVDARRR